MAFPIPEPNMEIQKMNNEILVIQNASLILFLWQHRVSRLTFTDINSEASSIIVLMPMVEPWNEPR